VKHPLWTGGPWDRAPEELHRPAGVEGLLFDLRSLPDEYDVAWDDEYRACFTSWLEEVQEVAWTRIEGEPRGPVIRFVARALWAACPPGRNFVCITFAELAVAGLCVPETARRVVRFLQRRGMLAISKGKTVSRKSGNVYSFRGLG
jgi:hypothetical protein